MPITKAWEKRSELQVRTRKPSIPAPTVLDHALDGLQEQNPVALLQRQILVNLGQDLDGGLLAIPDK
jgi:hypothetical protein